MLTIIYHVLDNRIPYQELGPDYFNTFTPKSSARYHTKKLEKLGFKVILEDNDMAA